MIPKEFREKLGLDRIGRATIQLSDNNEIVLTPPKTLNEVRAILCKPTFKDTLSDREKIIGSQLAKEYDVS